MDDLINRAIQHAIRPGDRTEDEVCRDLNRVLILVNRQNRIRAREDRIARQTQVARATPQELRQLAAKNLSNLRKGR